MQQILDLEDKTALKVLVEVAYKNLIRINSEEVIELFQLMKGKNDSTAFCLLNQSKVDQLGMLKIGKIYV